MRQKLLYSPASPPGKLWRWASLIILLTFLGTSYPAFSQATNIDIWGKVTDENGLGLPGVNILEKGTSNGASTDADGSYKLNVRDRNAVLVVSFVGYIAKEITVGNNTSLDVMLLPDLKALEEVVVVGYGTMKKRDMTGAVSQISTSKLQNEAPAQVQDLLRGNAAGLNVGYSASAKGGGNLQIRGRTSLNAAPAR